MQKTQARFGVAFEVALDFASAPLLRRIHQDRRNRLYFETGEESPEEKFSDELVDFELGGGSVASLLACSDEEAWRQELERLRLAPPVRQVVTVHHNLFVAQESNLGARVQPCLLRLHDLTPTSLLQRLQEAVKSLLALGVPEDALRVGSVLSEWS
jgi:hypothetical protein